MNLDKAIQDYKATLRRGLEAQERMEALNTGPKTDTLIDQRRRERQR